jgi:hypothetical protein
MWVNLRCASRALKGNQCLADWRVGLEIDQHREIERLARLDAPFHHGRDVGDDIERKSTLLLERRPDVGKHHLGDARAKDLELGAAGAHGERECRDDRSNPDSHRPPHACM